jgi:hypothetical protein
VCPDLRMRSDSGPPLSVLPLIGGGGGGVWNGTMQVSTVGIEAPRSAAHIQF